MQSTVLIIFNSHTFTHMARLEIINILEKKYKTPLNITTETGMTPLHLAVIGGRQQTVEYLVSEMGVSYLDQTNDPNKQIKKLGSNLWGQTFGVKPLGSNLWVQTFGVKP